MLISLFRVYGAVSSWHKADIPTDAVDVRYEGEMDTGRGIRSLRAPNILT